MCKTFLSLLFGSSLGRLKVSSAPIPRPPGNSPGARAGKSPSHGGTRHRSWTRMMEEAEGGSPGKSPRKEASQRLVDARERSLLLMHF